MIECRGRQDSRHPCDLRCEVTALGDTWRGGRDHVRTDGELRIDTRLLVVGRREDPEVHTEREQQTDENEAAVDRRSAPACTCQQERTPRCRAPSGTSADEERQRAPAN